MNNRFSSTKWFLLPLFIFAGLTLYLLIVLLQKTHGHLVYIADDPYIHLSMASHFASSRIWGVSFDHFANASSSPLWTLILSCFGWNLSLLEQMPLFLNLSLAIFLFGILWHASLEFKLSTPLRLSYLLSVILFGNIVPVVFSGMEYVLQSILIMLFVFRSIKPEKSSKNQWLTILLVSALVLTRFESIFTILAAMIVFFGNKQGRDFARVGLTSGFVLTATSIFSLWHSGLFLPNSFVLNSNSPGISSVTILQFGGKFLLHIVSAPHLTGLIIISIYILIKARKGAVTLHDHSKKLILIFILSDIFHFLFGRIGFFNRSEDYLMILGLSALFLTFPEWKNIFYKGTEEKTQHRFIITLISLIAIFLAWRAGAAMASIPISSKMIYDQQYQVGLFLKEYEHGKSVVLNDIGASSFLGNVHVIDIRGVGHDEIANLRKRWSFSTSDLIRIAGKENASIAVVYDNLFFKEDIFLFIKPFFNKVPLLSFLKPYFMKFGIGEIPKDWIKVAEWKIPDNYACESNTISFYALDVKTAPELFQNIKNFALKLPSDVSVTFY